MDSMDTASPEAAFRHKVYVDENGLETTLLESRKVCTHTWTNYPLHCTRLVIVSAESTCPTSHCFNAFSPALISEDWLVPTA